MTILEIMDFFTAIVQSLIWAYALCRFNPVKKKFIVSVLISTFVFLSSGMVCMYIIGQKFFIRLIFITFYYGITALYIIDDKWWKRLLRMGVFELGILAIDIFCITVAFPMIYYGTYTYLSAEVSLLARNLYNLIVYLVIVLGETYIRFREKVLYADRIGMLQLLLVGSQSMILIFLYRFNLKIGIIHVTGVSLFSVLLIFIDYFVTNEFFRQIIKQQKRETQLEQEMLKRQYQYDYYLLAQKEGEEIRDLRHDMKNHLQAMSYLVQLDGKEEQQRALEMLERLKQKLND